jgi:hypothetical protein
MEEAVPVCRCHHAIGSGADGGGGSGSAVPGPAVAIWDEPPRGAAASVAHLAACHPGHLAKHPAGVLPLTYL